eukprot:TRINITY_DN8756_c0_g1_i1.p1 TRINITY_DN8756_c0_g1~~TRINITY_DN8756_c0_g1_i1.p1  ORF type:complete len:114 (-),score=28.64 TRINITY_DN8756_c0_g1_i1:22-363(-)
MAFLSLHEITLSTKATSTSAAATTTTTTPTPPYHHSHSLRAQMADTHKLCELFLSLPSHTTFYPPDRLAALRVIQSQIFSCFVAGGVEIRITPEDAVAILCRIEVNNFVIESC